jgi:tetratricopeptide (TPR) repeat protein
MYLGPTRTLEVAQAMARDDWYRRSTWSAADQEEFFTRLKRSRTPENKSQYLRIQAGYLAEAGKHAAAVALLDQLFREFPGRFEAAQSHWQKAECMIALKRTEAAIDEFRASLQAQRDFPNVCTDCWLLFPWFIVREKMAALYDEAVAVLQEFKSDSALTFPIQQYQYAAARALIAAERGDKDTAREFAKTALHWETVNDSGFRYHPKLGLVDRIDADIHDRLVLAAGKQERDAVACDRGSFR